MAKSNSIITVTPDAEGKALAFMVNVGTDEHPQHVHMTLDLARLSPHNREYAVLHGMKARIVDSAALPFNKLENRYPTALEKADAMRRLVDHYNSGSDSWTLHTAARDDGGGLLFRALMAERPERDAEKLRAKLKEMSAAQKRAMLDSDRLLDIVRKLRAEMVKEIDQDKLFEGLDD